jgi:hypothetical protein
MIDAQGPADTEVTRHRDESPQRGYNDHASHSEGHSPRRPQRPRIGSGHAQHDDGTKREQRQEHGAMNPEPIAPKRRVNHRWNSSRRDPAPANSWWVMGTAIAAAIHVRPDSPSHKPSAWPNHQANPPSTPAAANWGAKPSVLRSGSVSSAIRSTYPGQQALSVNRHACRGALGPVTRAEAVSRRLNVLSFLGGLADEQLRDRVLRRTARRRMLERAHAAAGGPTHVRKERR